MTAPTTQRPEAEERATGPRVVGAQARELARVRVSFDAEVTQDDPTAADDALDRPIVGCPFEPRCDRAFDRCKVETPALISVARSHEAACHLNDAAIDGSVPEAERAR